MSAIISYPNAPITEAIIDLRVQLAADADRAGLRLVGEQLQADYPRADELFLAEGEMEVGPQGGSASVRHRSQGWKFSSGNGKQILQVRDDGFTFSRLAPYDCWDTFQVEARRTWTAYRDSLHPASVERLAVRYINRIDVPGETVDLSKYFRTYPEVSPELPQELVGFFVQLRLPFPELSAIGIINQTTVPPAQAGRVSIVLDIDLFRLRDIPQDEEGIWSFFEKLHVEKNRIFEACITDASRRLFA